jgi:hypothetical protein
MGKITKGIAHAQQYMCIPAALREGCSAVAPKARVSLLSCQLAYRPV